MASIEKAKERSANTRDEYLKGLLAEKADKQLSPNWKCPKCGEIMQWVEAKNGSGYVCYRCLT